jgi:hypothetical protein
LGGDLLASRRALLENPLYPDPLIKDFGDAEFEVIDWSRSPSKAISVDVSVMLGTNETVKWRLTMQRDVASQSGLLIVDLTTMPQVAPRDGGRDSRLHSQVDRR